MMKSAYQTAAILVNVKNAVTRPIQHHFQHRFRIR
jgi:hypothetical protein